METLGQAATATPCPNILVDPPAWRQFLPVGGDASLWLAHLMNRPKSRDPEKHPIDYLVALGLLIRAWKPLDGDESWLAVNEAVEIMVHDWYETQPEPTRTAVMLCVDHRLSDLIASLDDILLGSLNDEERGMTLRRLIQNREELECLQTVVKNDQLHADLDRFDAKFEEYNARWRTIHIKPFSVLPMRELFHALYMQITGAESPWIRRYVICSSGSLKR